MVNFVLETMGFDEDIDSSAALSRTAVSSLLPQKPARRTRKIEYHHGNHDRARELGIPFVIILFQATQEVPVPLFKSNAENSEMTREAQNYLHLSARNSELAILHEKLEKLSRGEFLSSIEKLTKYRVNEICQYFHCSASTFWRILDNGDQGKIRNNKLGKVGPKRHINNVIVS